MNIETYLNYHLEETTRCWMGTNLQRFTFSQPFSSKSKGPWYTRNELKQFLGPKDWHKKVAEKTIVDNQQESISQHFWLVLTTPSKDILQDGPLLVRNGVISFWPCGSVTGVISPLQGPHNSICNWFSGGPILQGSGTETWKENLWNHLQAGPPTSHKYRVITSFILAVTPVTQLFSAIFSRCYNSI